MEEAYLLLRRVVVEASGFEGREASSVLGISNGKEESVKLYPTLR
jgi:hypothetical protein